MARFKFSRPVVLCSGLLVLLPMGIVTAFKPQAGDEALIQQESSASPRPTPEPSSTFLGVIIPEEVLAITPPVTGRLKRVPVKTGDHVEEGAVVAEFEDQALRQELAGAQAALQSLRAEQRVAELGLSQAKQRLARREDPEQLRLGALSKEELETSRYELRLASARVDVSRAKTQEQETRVARLQQDIAEARLRAPFTGVVSNRYLDPGARVEPGQTILHLLRTGKTQVRFAIPEQAVRQVSLDQPVRVELPEQGTSYTGRVASLAPEVDAASRMVFGVAEVKASTPHPELVSGAVVRVRVLPALAQGRPERRSPELPP